MMALNDDEELFLMLQVGHALNMVAELPTRLDREHRMAWTVRLACLDSFLVNARLLADFFERRESKTTDISARRFASRWKASKEHRAVLHDLRDDVGKHTAHLTDARLVQPLPRIPAERMSQVTDALINLAYSFAEALRLESPEVGSRFVEHLRQVERRRSWPPPPLRHA